MMIKCIPKKLIGILVALAVTRAAWVLWALSAEPRIFIQGSISEYQISRISETIKSHSAENYSDIGISPALFFRCVFGLVEIENTLIFRETHEGYAVYVRKNFDSRQQYKNYCNYYLSPEFAIQKFDDVLPKPIF